MVLNAEDAQTSKDRIAQNNEFHLHVEIAKNQTASFQQVPVEYINLTDFSITLKFLKIFLQAILSINRQSSNYRLLRSFSSLIYEMLANQIVQLEFKNELTINQNIKVLENHCSHNNPICVEKPTEKYQSTIQLMTKLIKNNKVCQTCKKSVFLAHGSLWIYSFSEFMNQTFTNFQVTISTKEAILSTRYSLEC